MEVVKAARVGLLEAKMTSQALKQEAKYISKPGMCLNRDVESVNASININKKLSQLEQAQQMVARLRELPDGRIRYYFKEISSRNLSPTKSACRVTKYSPKTASTRSWYEL